jgi:hypothetical protein
MAVRRLRYCASEERSACDRRLRKRARAVQAFMHNRVFCADALFIRAENAVGARSAQWSLVRNACIPSCSSSCRAITCADASRPRGSPIAYGRKARPYAIGDLVLTPKSLLRTCRRSRAFIHNRVFCADALFIRAENAVGARSAQRSLVRIDRSCAMPAYLRVAPAVVQ